MHYLRANILSNHLCVASGSHGLSAIGTKDEVKEAIWTKLRRPQGPPARSWTLKTIISRYNRLKLVFFCLCLMMEPCWSERLLICDGLTQRQQCRHLPTLSQLWQKGHTVVHQLTFALFSTNMSSPLWWGDTKTTQRRFQNEHFEICSWQTKKKNGALGNQKSSTGQWPPRELVNWPTQLQSWNHFEKVQKGKWGKRGWH